MVRIQLFCAPNMRAAWAGSVRGTCVWTWTKCLKHIDILFDRVLRYMDSEDKKDVTVGSDKLNK